MRLYSAVVVAALSIFIASCNTTPVKQEPLLALSPAQIQEVRNYDELVSMHATLSSGLAGKSQAEYADDYAALAQIEAQIVDVKKSELSSQFAAKRLANGAVPQPLLEATLSDLKASAPVPVAKWQAVLGAVEGELARTQATATELEGKVAAESDSQTQVKLYEELYAVTGQETWKAKSDELLDKLVEDVRAAVTNESFDEATKNKVDLIKSIRGEDASLLDEMIGVDAKIYAKRFFDFLGEGLADLAYKTLVTMSEANDFPAIKDKLTPTSEKMANYFTALADESVKSPENLSQSYRWYDQAREVRNILGVAPANANSFTALADQLHSKSKALDESGETAAALAYLYSIRNFVPNRPGLRKQLNDQQTKVRDLAIKRLSTTDFESPYKDQDYGDVISSFITQYLFEHVPHDVRIVEREQYDAILRERAISGDSSSLSSVNLLVSGSVLESKVDSTEAKNKKMMRVEVGNETIPNPNYIRWLELPSKERKEIEKPSETIDVPKHENISVGVTRHRKVGIFSVSYRLVEASTGRVIFPDSITMDSEHQDESSEGVEMGDFVIPFKLADLPSDVEILDDLAKKVAEQIGKKLVNELKDQEAKYLADAETFKQQNDCAGEVSALGHALMIMELKGQDSSKVAPRFQKHAVACFN